MRIDVRLFEAGLANSRTHGANLVKLGKVYLNGENILKPSFEVASDALPEIREDKNFYSLGGYKLEKAFSDFPVSAAHKTALDAGCANGGFTGVLLDRGAESVYAVDVGENALPEALKRDSRVVFLRKNVRELTPSDFNKKIELIVSDLSFISLKLVLPVFYSILPTGGEGVFLIKPQFEAGRAALGKTGVVTEEKTRKRVVKDLSSFAEETGFRVLGVTEAPHPFPDKNQEYLLYCKR